MNERLQKAFTSYATNLLKSKGLRMDTVINIDGCSAIRYADVVNGILDLPDDKSSAIITMLVEVDIMNGDTLSIFEGVALKLFSKTSI